MANPYRTPSLFAVCDRCHGTGNLSGSYVPDDAYEPARCPHCSGQGLVLRAECELTCASITDELAALNAELLVIEVPARRDEILERMVMLEDVLEMEGCED